MKALLVHGVGFHEATDQLTEWVPSWIDAMTRSAKAHTGISLVFQPPFGLDGKPSGLGGPRAKDPGILYYEDLIRRYNDPNTLEYIGVVSSLLASAVTTTVGDLFRRDRGMFDIPEEFKWKAREVAAWVCNDSLRTALRERVIEEIRNKDPEIVIAHSYGGIITYDACLLGDPDLLKDRHLITLGTQVGNPLLRREFGGYQSPVRCRHWFNLFNPHDKIFVSSLEHIRADNFTQILTPHMVGSGHDGATYLSHPDFATLAWPHMVNAMKKGKSKARGLGLSTPSARDLAGGPRGRTATSAPVGNRALLIGVDLYSNTAIPSLQGCVNDTFELSASLQEAGIDHRQIRLVHNGHATRKGLLNHIRWLLEDARPGDHRFLSFSGHGHRRPSYGPGGEPLEMHEILCTHDYDPSTDSGIRDSDLQDLYANLPRGVHFTIFLDCCHAGGMPGRAGGPAIRSFYGPSDIEHESSKWNSDLEMWEQGPLLAKGLNPLFLPPRYHSRHLAKLWQDLRRIRKNPLLTASELHRHETDLYYGTSGDTRRIGRASQLRDLSHQRYDEITRKLGKMHAKGGGKKASIPTGPYLPLIFMACGETESANEYVHGAVSYGAFTYALTLTLRGIKHKDTPALSYGELLLETARKLQILGYSQTPDILGPPDQLTAATPFKIQAPRGKRK